MYMKNVTTLKISIARYAHKYEWTDVLTIMCSLDHLMNELLVRPLTVT